MRFILLVVLTLLLITSAHAQLRKCVGVDGRVTYSDVLCGAGSSSGTIKNQYGNTMDASGHRQQVERNQAEREAAESRPALTTRQSPPQECKFTYFSLGDEKGKVLAANAKAECLQNNEAKLNGQPISLEHYTYWNDYHSRKSNNRQTLITRANSDRQSELTRQNTNSQAELTRENSNSNARAINGAIDRAADDITHKSVIKAT